MSVDVPPGRLDVARQQAGLSVEELWIRYFGNGGTATVDEFQTFLTEHTWPERLQYDITASALNDRFTEMELDHPVPYSSTHTGGGRTG